MGHIIQETTVTVFIGNYIRRVNVIKGSLYSRVYGISFLGRVSLRTCVSVGMCCVSVRMCVCQ